MVGGLWLVINNVCITHGSGLAVDKIEWLPDGSEKPGDDLCNGLCRTCNEQPELKFIKITVACSPIYSS